MPAGGGIFISGESRELSLKKSRGKGDTFEGKVLKM